MSARKDDHGKPPLSLIPRSALLAVARVMAKGKSKYGAHNWRSGGMDWSRMLDAAMRHQLDFQEGIDFDDGEGGSRELHIANAICDLMFLIEYYEKGLGNDDRFKDPEEEKHRQPGEIELVLLDNRPEQWPRRTLEGECISLPPTNFFARGSAVWARRDADGRLVYESPFDFDWNAYDGGAA